MEIEFTDLDHLNPDAMDPAELLELIHHLETLREYCRTKHHAMTLRLAGDITRALTAEDCCEALYKCMPTSWHW